MATELGERLNLALNFEGQVIANVYFHWSATTFEGLCMAIDIVKSLQNGVPTLSHNSLLLADFGLTMNSDAGYNEESLQYMNEHYPQQIFRKPESRTYGLIGITAADKEKNEAFADATITISMDEHNQMYIDMGMIEGFQDYATFEKEFVDEHELRDVHGIDLNAVLPAALDFKKLTLNDARILAKALYDIEEATPTYFVYGEKIYPYLTM